MLPFPKKIMLLGREFELLFHTGKDPITLEDDKGNSKTAGAYVDFNSMQIVVDANMNERTQWSALFHEVVHVGLDVSGIDQTLDDFAVEVICQTLGNTFYDLVVSFNNAQLKGTKKPKRRN